MESFDYVIVGGGTAAGVLAWRLGEAGHSVCVLEAGPADDSAWTRIPAGFTRLLRDPRYSWQLECEPSEGTAGRRTALVQGRTLGGSSAVNGAVYSRGQALDFDTWESLGNTGWGYRDVLPYFRRSEGFVGQADDAFHGRDGPMRVQETPWRDALCETFLQAAHAAGIPRSADYNGATQAGIGYTQSVIHQGRRWSTAHAFLHPAEQRFRTRVITRARVNRILTEHRRATGVEFQRDGDDKREQVLARREVLVCAGAIHSPQLLQLSGIGPAALLQPHGIRVVHALPGVGENLRDHYCPRFVARTGADADSINRRVRGLRLAGEVAAWAMKKPSILSISPILIYGFWKTRAELPSPDFALSFISASYSLGRLGEVDEEPGLTCGAWQLRPQSQGHVRIRSSNVGEQPLIQPNYLSHETDRRVVVDALRWVRRIFQTEPMRSTVRAELLPGPQVQTDDEFLDFVRRYAVTGYHVVGTCKMGPASDPLAVVDPQLRVHGMQGLRVIDASVMPTITSANTCAATVMLAEKAADMLLDRTSEAAPRAKEQHKEITYA
ncbi:MAG: GMC family oxidoreductase N-terminal domain-containing protein [Bordetella sp.]|nr:GMC family oxidoreductase N-terminal domain-containing protein [Bordetella sp.]